VKYNENLKNLFQVVLAGDPMQLGSVLRSTIAKDYGLQSSYLERLMDLEMYKRDEKKFVNHGSYDPMLVCHTLFVTILLSA